MSFVGYSHVSIEKTTATVMINVPAAKLVQAVLMSCSQNVVD